VEIGVGHNGLQVLGVVQLFKGLAKAEIFDNLNECDNLHEARTAVDEPMSQVEEENPVSRVQHEVEVSFALKCVLGVGSEANV